MFDSRRELIWFIIMVIMSNGGGIFLGYGAWSEWRLQQELSLQGVQTQATITDCGQLRNGQIWFEFETLGENGIIENYKIRGDFGYFSCMSGDLITIRYLPEDPSQASTMNSSYYKTLMIFSCIGLAIPWVGLLLDFIDKKRKGWI